MTLETWVSVSVCEDRQEPTLIAIFPDGHGRYVADCAACGQTWHTDGPAAYPDAKRVA